MMKDLPGLTACKGGFWDTSMLRRDRDTVKRTFKHFQDKAKSDPKFATRFDDVKQAATRDIVRESKSDRRERQLSARGARDKVPMRGRLIAPENREQSRLKHRTIPYVGEPRGGSKNPSSSSPGAKAARYVTKTKLHEYGKALMEISSKLVDLPSEQKRLSRMAEKLIQAATQQYINATTEECCPLYAEELDDLTHYNLVEISTDGALISTEDCAALVASYDHGFSELKHSDVVPESGLGDSDVGSVKSDHESDDGSARGGDSVHSHHSEHTSHSSSVGSASSHKRSAIDALKIAASAHNTRFSSDDDSELSSSSSN